MPVYEYVCQACGYGFERIQSFNDRPVARCPNCKGKVRRVISPVGVIFKGSGWYITDNRRQISGAKKPALSDKGETDGSASSAGAAEKGPAGPKEGAGADGATKTDSGKEESAGRKKTAATEDAS